MRSLLPLATLLFCTLLEGLVENGAMTAAEAKVLDRRIEVVVDDQRTDKTKPLPVVPEAEARPR